MARPVKPADFKLYSTISEPSFSPDGQRVAFSVKKANIDEDSYDSDIFISDFDGGEPRQFTTGKKDSDPKWSPDGSSIIFLSRRNLKKDEKGNGLYVISSAGGEARLLRRSEDGIDSPVWSPGSKEVYFLSNVVKKPKDDVKVIQRLTFWFNGVGFMYNKRKHLFRVSVKSGKVEQLTRGPFDVASFDISPDGKKAVIVVPVSDSKPYLADAYLMDLKSKKRSRLTRSDMALDAVAWSPDSKKLALSGSRLPSGFASHSLLWILDVATKRLTQEDKSDRNKSNGLNSDARARSHGPGNLLWTKDGIYCVQADGGSVHLYLVKPGDAPRLVVGGERSVEGFDAAKGRVAFVAMDSDHLEEVYAHGRPERQLTKLNAGVYQELNLTTPHHISFKASDGEEVEGWVLVPKSKSKVPGVLYVHGGPKTAFGHAYMHEFQAFASAGYAVVYLNPRGSDGYSEKFADIRGKYGTRDFQDLMEGLDHALKKFPAIDGERVAIAGGSYGGFMTNWAVGHTRRFKAGVSDRSISSWTSFWGTSDIGPYFTQDQVGGDPWSSEEKLANDSPLRYAPNVVTPVMLVHSMEDFRCWMVEGLQFFTALKHLGKEAELVLFPGENHDLSRVGKPKHRVARLEHYIRWFDQHLKRPR